MNDQDRWWLRLGMIDQLVSQASSNLGRTAITKLAYLLQSVKGVPLGYHFGLHTYGPFDSDVLHDLAAAESLGIVKSQMVVFPSGYGYEFSPGDKQDVVRSRVADRLAEYQPAIQWALEEFGHEKAADLELISTIIYVDREAGAEQRELSGPDLGRRVKDIKPRFSDDYIAKRIQELADKGLLIATALVPQI
jgi:hypothetical protein